MVSPAFRKAVQAAFECSAVRLVESGDKVLQKCGPKGLHAMLASCHNHVQDASADAVTLTMENLNAYFKANGWADDFSPTWNDINTLLASLTQYMGTKNSRGRQC